MHQVERREGHWGWWCWGGELPHIVFMYNRRVFVMHINRDNTYTCNLLLDISFSCSVIVRESVVLKRTVGDSD